MRIDSDRGHAAGQPRRRDRGARSRLTGLGRRVRHGAVAAAVLLIRGYQGLIRPHLVGACKFCPTCSEYAVEALHAYGLIRGTGLAVRRLWRCHPFSPGGIDPVP